MTMQEQILWTIIIVCSYRLSWTMRTILGLVPQVHQRDETWRVRHISLPP